MKTTDLTKQIEELKAGKESALIGDMFEMFGRDAEAGIQFLARLTRGTPYQICSGTADERQNVYLRLRYDSR